MDPRWIFCVFYLGLSYETGPAFLYSVRGVRINKTDFIINIIIAVKNALDTEDARYLILTNVSKCITDQGLSPVRSQEICPLIKCDANLTWLLS